MSLELFGLEKEFYLFCLENKDGVTDRAFREMKNEMVKPLELVSSINSLVSRGLIELFRSPKGGLVYRAFQKEEVDLILSLEGDEKIVYQCIKGSGNRGIWTRDLKTRTNLHQTVITKVLRSLDNRRLIKSIKSVKNSTRKVYMLYNLEPSIEVTGGPWFSENELDLEFIEEMCKVCLRYIENKEGSPLREDSLSRQQHAPPPLYPQFYDDFASIEEIHSFIIDKQITTALLTHEDMQLLINRLVLDGMVEGIPRKDNSYVYKRSQKEFITTFEDDSSEIPCIRCPVKKLCSKGGIISPEHCVYLENYF